MKTRTQYLLLLFVFGVIAKGLAKSTFGSNLSIVLLISVALYYWRTKEKEKSVYDDIALKQAEAAAKLDALHGLGDGKVTDLSMASRKTHFTLNDKDNLVITDRIHQYSRKFSGSQKDRRKFLKKNARKVAHVDIDANDPAQMATAMANVDDGLNKSGSTSSSTPETSMSENKQREKNKLKNRKGKKKPAVETIVEEAVDATL